MIIWELTKSLLAAFGFSLIFYVIVPLVVLFIALGLFSTAATLDPLHAGSQIGNVWTGFINFSIIQIIFSIAAIVCVTALSIILVKNFDSEKIYLIAGAASFVVHLALMAIVAGGVYLVKNDGFAVKYAVIFSFSLIILAPLLGIITTALVRWK